MSLPLPLSFSPVSTVSLSLPLVLWHACNTCYLSHTVRLIAIALLPINRETLVYGSSNGGKTVFNSDERMTALMAEVGEKLHLRKHKVRPFSSKNGTAAVELHGPVDIEGHVGLDSRYYVVDAARLLPCEAPASAYNGNIEKSKGEHLYKLLRPEFLRMMPSLGLPRLSSDAFSSFSVAEEREEVQGHLTLMRASDVGGE